MQRQPALTPLISSSHRSRSLRTLVLFSSFSSSMETPPPFSSPIASADSAVSSEGSAAAEFGFRRAEFGQKPLVGTVQSYDRHVFLRYTSPEIWPPNVESADSDSLPRLLAAAIKARKDDMKKKTRLTICGAEDNADTSDGDVLIFPDRIGYRSLKDVDIDNFVELVLVKDTEWLPGAAEKLTGSYVFVCAHGSRDRRCGVCGPALIEKFKEEISLRGLEDQVFVSPCSHIGGHKYAGNILIFSQNKIGEVFGHWYGYVSPDDVSILLEQHIGKGEIVDYLWRGQMGLSEEEQRKAQSIRLGGPNIRMRENGANKTIQGSESGPASENMKTTSCCQGNGNSSCCQNTTIVEKPDANHTSNSKESRTSNNSCNSSVIFKNFTTPTWLKGPERDTFVTLAVVAAIASAGAYCCYRQMK